ncbi:ion-translocating NADH:ferredoxin oxidoreductase complex Rnf, membrane protein subunit RnfE [Syntrophotalea carbinolica DSM 2380]|uniref:Ion-translocating oxidoreductase complex subunit E n=1 Tax=Syntrophotalea carbinolica (strain DSM 2380 / NBRC 103641 / GraBd1) TaxID=338963 RepID=Q3A7X1_SYNC1|nr:electron transport complex subunit E [Syntrophotalea carbinolica]ABA87521.1 ion-translocating NADH:ferredoxin oxidoreductase complex Rnf, membrane protein subunit RnfE [Syntrophotalea carbinolica DSM 2380]
MKLWAIFSSGLWRNNAIFKLVLGMCPTLAVTTSAMNGLGMGLATTSVLLCSNMAVSALRTLIPAKVRIPAFIVIIATFVTVVQLLMEAYAFELYQALGIFIPLIVVNCLILGRAEAFASRQPLWASAADGAGMGLGFTLALVMLGGVRELLGAGSLFGLQMTGAGFHPMLLMILPPGAFLALGFLLAAINGWKNRKRSISER